jgi:hypothetical protein
MSDRPEANKTRSDGGGRDQRKDRLKLALRENLKRRKAQARGRNHDAVRSEAASEADADAIPKGFDV